MLQKKDYKVGELILLFIITPILLALDIAIAYKVAAVLCGICYCVWLSVYLKLITIKALYTVDIKTSWFRILLTFTVISISSYVFVSLYHPDDVLKVVKEAPMLWVTILFVYAFLSVYPQELLYRAFYFNRYQGLFPTQYLLLINVVVFSIAHLVFDNSLVLLVTLIGGVLFTYSYHRHNSLLLNSIEHALYGNILFTVGMGEMLAFPMPY